MKIKEIYFYSCGHFQDFTLPVFPSLTVAVGHNELGKTTLRHGIFQLLYGPQPKRLIDGYEFDRPVSGYLVMEKSDGSTYKLERRVGKEKELFLTSEDGRILSEEERERWLNGVTAQTFHSIFTFNVLDLQQVQKVNEQELSRILFTTALIGRDELEAAEKNLTQQMDDRFKPQGRKPLINTLLKDREQVKKEIGKMEKNQEEVLQLLAKTPEKEQVVTTHYQELAELTEQLHLLEQTEEKWELLSDYHTLQVGDKAPGDSDVTEQVNTYLQLEADKSRLLEELEYYLEKVEVEEKHVHQKEDKRKQLHLFKESLEGVEEQLEIQSSIETLENTKQKLHIRINQVLQSIGINRYDETFDVTVPVYMEEEVREMQREKEVNARELEKLEEMKRPLVSEKDELENRINRLEIDRAEGKTNSLQKFSLKLILLPTAILLVISIICLLLSEFVAAGVSIISSMVIVTMYLLNRGKKASSKEFDSTWKAALFALDQVVEKMHLLEENQQRVKRKIDKWERNYERLLAELQLPANTPLDALPSILFKLQEMTQLIEEEKEVIAELNERRNYVNDRRSILSKIHFIQGDRPLQEIRNDLKNSMAKVEEELLLIAKKEELIEDWRDKIVRMTARKSILDNQLKEELVSAEVSSKQELLQKKEIWMVYRSQQEELSEIRQRVTDRQYECFVSFSTKDELLQAIRGKKEEKAELQENVRTIQEEIIKVKQEVKRLEENGTYLLKVQELIMMEEKIKLETKEWMKAKIALASLQHAIQQLEAERLPAVMGFVNRYLQVVTAGKYHTFMFQNQVASIQRQDGSWMTPNVMSQGTKELLYILIRIALAVELNEKGCFPLLMDDSFVHIDPSRREALFTLLNKEGIQTIYFTCQDHEILKECHVNLESTVVKV
ncbi:AAA family ATPase [Mangrovibacillus cuniculi]|uniref:AAA family ATPase n=1 Tax=Mangrovibacillus cuniculi TaxID=2593652 RepID=A0A7S8HEQ9_9BACI|nr:AAA family ATPase [Mangrovibacillus cuniculi]QPC45982.1 AAA family ATPase [Mangrovibacillus cuniculi]